MAINEQRIFHFANFLDEAVITRKEVRRLTFEEPKLDIADAYRIQEEGIRLREARGEKIVGYKMGLTSKAKMQQMGVSSPISGVLTDAMRLPDGGGIELRDRIHPKVEPEIAFITNRDLRGEVSREEFLAACSGVFPALEIIDSRFLNFDFTLADVLADNCSSSGFVLGAKAGSPAGLQLDQLPMRMWINDRIAQSGESSAIYGHPVDSCLELIRHLTKTSLGHLPAGSIVLAGGATAAEAIGEGDLVRLEVEGLGSVSAKVTH